VVAANARPAQYRRAVVADGSVRCTYFGTSTIHLTDGSTSLLVDGFFSRPALLRVATGRPLAPDPERIEASLARGGIQRLDALFVAHSHFDHAMDAGEVVLRVGGVLHGSESTLNVGRGAGLGAQSLALVADGDEVGFGDFSVRVLAGAHSPGDRYPGTIDAPLRPPASAGAYRTGECFSFLFRHPRGTVLVHPSANVVPGQFDGVGADLLYLGIGALGAQSDRFRQDYWRHTVDATAPALIVPVHWDNFGKGLGTKLRPLPRPFDNFRRTRAFLAEMQARTGIPVQFQHAYETLTPFG
jgi:L-ascorbate metabolism protein UlaG (beta-lactamase superfamily)